MILTKKSPLPLKPQNSNQTSPLEAAIKRGEEAKKRFLSKQGGALTNIEACSILGCSLLELETMRRNHQVLGLSVNGDLVYPAWQFVGSKVLTGLDKVLAALKDDGAWTQMLFLLTGDIRLDGATPLKQLKEGKFDQVVWAAKCYGSHSAA
ncbi:MAG: hypothetical protein ACRC6M_10030 [Microcystaceae cyanobacterium]